MLTLKRRSVYLATGFVLCLFAVYPTLGAQDHVVSPAEMRKEAVAATSARQQNVETINRFLSSPQTKQALQSVHMNPTQVKTAVSNLSDEEVAQLASRADKAQADFAAGTFSDRDLIFIALAVLLVILIIVAVR
jgi:hypothetical protein